MNYRRKRYDIVRTGGPEVLHCIISGMSASPDSQTACTVQGQISSVSRTRAQYTCEELASDGQHVPLVPFRSGSIGTGWLQTSETTGTIDKRGPRTTRNRIEKEVAGKEQEMR